MRVYRLGDVVVYADQNRIVRRDGEIHVEPKVMSLLTLLVEHASEVVPRNEFLDVIWAGTVVAEEAVTRCVSELRTALGDDRRAPMYIQTVPKAGYRLIVEPRRYRDRGRRTVWIAAGVALTLTTIISTWAVGALRAGPPSIAGMPFSSLSKGQDASCFSASSGFRGGIAR